MLGNFLIGLREGLEAALIVSILLAYLNKVGRSKDTRWVWTGVGIAVGISLLLGAILTYGPKGLTFEAQELIGGVLSIVAAGLVTWMVLWMAQASRTLSKDLKNALDQALSPKALVGVALLAVGREGLETALFIWAATKAAARESGSTSVPLIGALIGIAVAVVIAALLHRGILSMNLSTFFTWTGALLIVIAAGVVAYGVHDLQEAGFLPGLNNLAFDLSGTIDPNGVFATVIKGVFNLAPQMTVLEVLVYVAYLAIVGTLFWRRIRAPHHNAAQPAAIKEKVPA